MHTGSEFILNKIKEINTVTKLKKFVRKSPLFVEPIEKSIGLKWINPQVDPNTKLPDHALTQSTFQYAPILKTLQSLFENEEFKNRYVKYNKHEKHKCVNGVYKDVCCGSVYRSKEIFKDPLALQLQIGVDDFEVCCPAKSKAKTHKVNATYFQIKDIPDEYRSKLDHIFLVALCSTINFAPDGYNYNHIAELAVKEINVLEMTGLNVGEECFKGALVNIGCDNLGASTVFGFVECFVATYFCRHCECSKVECQTMLKEDKRKMRTKSKYVSLLKKLDKMDQSKIDYKETKGIKRKCSFNESKYYHIIDNSSVDVMHDVNEGVVSYGLRDFFNLIVKKKL